MVDREARDRMGFLLRRLTRKRITEKEFDKALEALPLSGQDRIVEAIFEESFDLGSTTRQNIARWILFLQSDAEYVWPGMDSAVNLVYIIGSVAAKIICDFAFHAHTLGWILAVTGLLLGYQQTARHYKPSDMMVWPFHRQQDFEEAKKHPRLLAGRR